MFRNALRQSTRLAAVSAPRVAKVRPPSTYLIAAIAQRTMHRLELLHPSLLINCSSRAAWLPRSAPSRVVGKLLQRRIADFSRLRRPPSSRPSSTPPPTSSAAMLPMPRLLPPRSPPSSSRGFAVCRRRPASPRPAVSSPSGTLHQFITMRRQWAMVYLTMAAQ